MVKKWVMFFLAGLGTLFSVFLLSSLNDAFLKHSPEQIKVFYLSSQTSLAKILEQYPGDCKIFCVNSQT